MKRFLALGLLAVSALSLPALEADDLSEVVGHFVVETTNVSGTFDGAEHGKVVKLDNGQIFEFTEYSYAYRPDVAIFAKKFSYRGSGVILYKLLIDDEFYDARRVR